LLFRVRGVGVIARAAVAANGSCSAEDAGRADGDAEAAVAAAAADRLNRHAIGKIAESRDIADAVAFRRVASTASAS
jgi:hypothetical protein